MSIFSKFLNSFKSLRLNKNNSLNGVLLDHLLVGSMYAEQQSAYIDSYETGINRSNVKKLIEVYWGIYSKDQAIEVLQGLQNRNQDRYIDFVYQAIEYPDNYVDILKSNLPIEEGIFEYYLNIYRNMKNAVSVLIAKQVISDFSQLKKIKDSGWNCGRGAFLARCCYEFSYLSERELQDYLANFYCELKGYCHTWKEYTTSYIFGRAIWNGENNLGMIQIAEDLLNNDKSPLKNKIYL